MAARRHSLSLECPTYPEYPYLLVEFIEGFYPELRGVSLSCIDDHDAQN
jgi:hypothetical protein